MTVAVFYKLAAILVAVAIGWIAGRMRWLGQAGGDGVDPARVLSNAAFYVFVPALLFRTTARLDLATMPWRTVAAFFVPVLAYMFAIYLWQRLRATRHGAAAPSVRAIGASFGNSVQIGIPVATALFGEPGLVIHVALVSLHALLLLSVLTALVELDLARARVLEQPADGFATTLRMTVRNTIVHPVVLPVLAGMAWNLAGLPLHPVLDESLSLVGSAVVPVCLVLVGLTLAYAGMPERVGGAVGIAAFKLLLLPALVLAVAHWGFGLDGMPLAVIVMMAALPVGSNALLFSQRYATLEAEANAAIVFSTVGFVLTGWLWLAALAWLAR